MHDSQDSTTEIFILNANKTEADILLRAEMEELGRLIGPARFRQHLVLSKAPEDGATSTWIGSKGRITKQMLVDHLPPPSEDALLLICGPDPMIHVSAGVEKL